jgi:hypothetical protein
MEIAFLFLIGCVVVSGYWLYRGYRGKGGVTPDEHGSESPTTQRSAWSGLSRGSLPVRQLTAPQRECLAEASYGVRILIGPLAQLNCLQPDGSSTHRAQTVEALASHGFLADDERGGYTITDGGMRASEGLRIKYRPRRLSSRNASSPMDTGASSY